MRMRVSQNRSALRYSLAINVSPLTTLAPSSILDVLQSLHHSGKNGRLRLELAASGTTHNCCNNILESSCSAIRLPKNDYPVFDTLGDELVASGKLSNLQLEGVRYACQKHLEVRLALISDLLYPTFKALMSECKPYEL